MTFNVKNMVRTAGTYLATGLALALLGCANPNREVLVSEAGETFYASRDVADHMITWAATEAYGGENPREGIVRYITENCANKLLEVLTRADKNKDSQITAGELRKLRGFAHISEKEDSKQTLEKIEVNNKVYFATPSVVDHLLFGTCARYSGGRERLKSGLCNERNTIGSILTNMARDADKNGDHYIDSDEFAEFNRTMKEEYEKNPKRKDSTILIPSLRDVVYDEETREGYLSDVFTKKAIEDLALKLEGKSRLDKSVKPSQKTLFDICRKANTDGDKEISRDEFLAYKRKMMQRK
jgi:hypothetical protein